MKSSFVTKDTLIALLAKEEIREQVIGRALVGLMNRQTEDEKTTNNTKHHNLRGFMPCDAKQGTIGAKTFIKRKSLLSFQVEYWMENTAKGYPRICKYTRQLNEISAEKKLKSAK